MVTAVEIAGRKEISGCAPHGFWEDSPKIEPGRVMAYFLRKLVAIAALAACSATAANAAGFAIREQSAEGLGASFAGVAAGTDGLSSMFWNAATMTLHEDEGFQSESNWSLTVPYSRAKDGVGGLGGSSDSGNIGELVLAPASYYVYKVNDRLFVGLGLNSPFGLATESDVWAGSIHGSESSLFTINANPNVAYKLSDAISVAAGVQLQYADANFESVNPATGTMVDNVEGDDFGVGFTAGVLFTPSDTTQIGIGFRSMIEHELKGKGFVGQYTGGLTTPLDTPEIVTLGIRQQIDERWTVMAGAEWANWSRFESFSVYSDPGGTLLTTTPENWKDSWFVSLGAEYAYSDALTLRAGLAYEDSGVPDSTRSPRIPDNDRYWVSVGATWQVNDWLKANVGYSHAFVENGNIALAGPPSLNASFKQSINIVSASAAIDW
jgi:long-chain fatty acid transport protein